MSILTELAKRAQTVLTLTVQRLSDEIKLNSQHESSARENLTLRLENAMLKFERRLPPAKSSEDQD